MFEQTWGLDCASKNSTGLGIGAPARHQSVYIGTNKTQKGTQIHPSYRKKYNQAYSTYHNPRPPLPQWYKGSGRSDPMGTDSVCDSGE